MLAKICLPVMAAILAAAPMSAHAAGSEDAQAKRVQRVATAKVRIISDTWKSTDKAAANTQQQKRVRDCGTENRQEQAPCTLTITELY